MFAAWLAEHYKLIVPGLASVFGFSRQSCWAFPALLEAARIDGANHWLAVLAHYGAGVADPARSQSCISWASGTTICGRWCRHRTQPIMVVLPTCDPHIGLPVWDDHGRQRLATCRS